MKTQKKGFTLIELMVVIVIIGILAAIAIPKLFGMSAKAKAQEVPGAAGTWTKMQAAYLMEKGALGGNKNIGYLFPGETDYKTLGSISSGFTYAVSQITLGQDITDVNGSLVWTAQPKVKLNDCENTAAQWTVSIDMANAVKASVGTNCRPLTPNFENLK